MEIQPIVIGTAGHIDHGKSTLVRALTGVDPDRLKEEKERGLTIDLGFAPLPLPDGRLVGIVDVPGHERFIRNMVAGATGIDLVILVVAADDGVMPQTREHLQIMELLGVARGLVALTKVDAVDEELVELAEEDVRTALAGTFLDGAPILRVSAKTGAGMEALKEVLFAAAGAAEPRSDEGVFRMPVQRVFSKQGFGTVVTGIPVSGSARVGDVLEVLPGGARAKVRGMNAYREKTDTVRAGHSSALNLADVDARSVQRGSVVAAAGFFEARRMVAARLSTLPDALRSVTNRMAIRLHTGTADIPGEVVLLDREELRPGESGLVQLRLSEPVVCAPGDRFVLRLLSPVETLGGGAILEESRHRLKRFKDFVIEDLAYREETLGTPSGRLEAQLREAGARLTTLEELTVAVKRERGEVRELLAPLLSGGAVVEPKPERYVHAAALERASDGLLATIRRWFSEHAHREQLDVRELRRIARLDEALLAVLLERGARAGHLELPPGGFVRLAGHQAELAPAVREAARSVTDALVQGGFQPPLVPSLREGWQGDAAALDAALEHLVDARQVVHVSGELCLAHDRLEEARAAVVENCERHGHLEIPELRDRLGTTRKYLIPLLEYFDGQGLTHRQGAHRVLRKR